MRGSGVSLQRISLMYIAKGPDNGRWRGNTDWLSFCRGVFGGAEGIRTPDLRIANNRASHSQSVTKAIFSRIFRDLMGFWANLAILNIPATSMHDYTQITHGSHYRPTQETVPCHQMGPIAGSRRVHAITLSFTAYFCNAPEKNLGKISEKLRSWVRSALLPKADI